MTKNKKVEEEMKKPVTKVKKTVLEEKKETEKGLVYYILKVLSWCAFVLLALIGVFLIIYMYVNKTAQAKGETPPLGLYTIISPSMTPNINVYDVVFVTKTDPEKIEIGDVISYNSTNSYFNGIPITHRVIEKLYTSEGIVFRTQGDANPVADTEMIMSGNVVGVVKAVIPQLGRIQFFLSSKLGWVVAILIPAAGVLIYDMVKLLKLLKARNETLEVRKALKDK